MERWLEIDQFPRYDVSSTGRVFDLRKQRILLQTPDSAGYLRVKLVSSLGRFTVSVHRLVAGTFYDWDITDWEINHLDGDKENNHLWNLEICNRSQNMQHAYALGLVSLPRETKVVCVETGEVYRTIREAARSIGISHHKAISRVLNNPDLSVRGFHFETVSRRG